MLARILQRIKDLPNTVKTGIGLISTIIPFVILLRANFELAVVLISATIVVALLSYLFYVAFAKTKSVVGFTRKGAGGYRYARHRPWAIFGMCAISLACLLLFIVKPTRYYIFAALEGTKVAPHARILIAAFEAKDDTNPGEIPDRIKRDLEKELRKHNLTGVKVETFGTPITSAQGAKTASEQADSKVVVWGWYDKNGITINIYTPEPPSTVDDALRLKEVPWTQGADIAADISLKVRERLPNNITFLSLFIIGSLYYQNNEYQNGHQAFDAAMDKLPREVDLENESLVHFFLARRFEASGNEDLERVVCEYSKSIELNPNFAAAYNNLGILFTKLLIASQTQPDNSIEESPVFDLSERSKACLSKIGIQDWGDVHVLFEKALSIQPNSAVILYNKVAATWRKENPEGFPEDSELVTVLDDILRKDPSIPGAHIMRGVLAFHEKDKDFNKQEYETALREFSNASRLMPRSAELHVNIGKVYLRKGRLVDARAEFDKALSLAPENIEVRLAIADVALKQGQADFALGHLNAINSDRREDRYSIRMGAMLKSRAYVELGNLAAAIDALLTNLTKQPDPPPAIQSEDSQSEGTSGATELNDNDTSLIHYVIGLLYTRDSNTTEADKHWRKCRIPSPDVTWADDVRKQAYNDNDTATLSWSELLSLCRAGAQDVSRWGATAQCLPHDLNQRLRKVFDIAQDNIVHRLFYRREVVFGGLACPYVFTYDINRGAWLFDTTILYGLNRRGLEDSQLRPLSRFDGRLIVREVEPESSHIDQISVVVVDRLGQLHILQPQLKILDSADGDYLILHQGDEVHLNFNEFQHIKGAVSFRVEAKGYYVPLTRDSLRTHRSVATRLPFDRSGFCF